MARGEQKTPEERALRWACRAVPCPYCLAEPGQKCTGVHGQRRYASHTERWALFDPTSVAAKAPRKEKMPRPPRMRDDFPENEDGVTCLRCKEPGLYWQMVTQSDGRSEKPVLFKDGHRHVCRPSADDFEDLTR